MSFFNEILNPAEFPLLKSFHDALQCRFLDATMPVISSLCKAGICWILLAAVLLIFRKTRKTSITVTLALILGLLVCNLTLKPLFARLRPYEFDTTVVLLTKKEIDFSFPSGHTMASFCASTGIFMNNRKWGAVAFAVACLIAFSRIYLMMHFFTDVIVSAILGVLLGVLAFFIVLFVWSRLPKKTDA